MKRNLTTVYSRLMTDNEEETVRTIKTYRKVIEYEL
jgi:hypothetical protein